MRVFFGFLGYVLLVAVIALAAHVATLMAYPSVAMERAIAVIAPRGEGVNAWRHSPRVTAQSQRIVRSSPDLAYSACAFDLWLGPVTIKVGSYADMWSLVLYDRASNVFGHFNDLEYPDGVTVTLIREGAAPPANAQGIVLESPSRRGIALVRRLAPTVSEFSAAETARRDDVCRG
jgi:uncharacterized membrane protein